MKNLKMIPLFVSLLCVGFLPACSKRTAPAPTDRESFASPEVALNSLVEAAGSTNRNERLMEIFGKESEELLFSGDAVADNKALDTFKTQIALGHNWAELQEDEQLSLEIGEKEWPFPIPLERNEAGWAFNTEAGKEEILDRRIGENEIGAIRVCRGYVDAQFEYAEKDRDGDGVREYAQRILSSPGKRDGLFWEDPKQRSPIGPAIAKAASEGYEKGKGLPYHGYHYRILTQAGPESGKRQKSFLRNGKNMTEGFALLAYPARYGSSGIMSFIVSHNDIVYERDFGEDTAAKAQAITSFNPDRNWEPVIGYSSRSR